MFMTKAFKVHPVDAETVSSASIVSFQETTLLSDHIPDKSELKGYMAPFEWGPVPESSQWFEYMEQARHDSLNTVPVSG
jgi:hypothetical protein